MRRLGAIALTLMACAIARAQQPIPGAGAGAAAASAGPAVANWNVAANTHIYVPMDSGKPINPTTMGFSTYTSKVIYVVAVPANVSGAITRMDGFYEGPLGGSNGGAVAVYGDDLAGTRALLASSTSTLAGQPQTWILSGTVTITAGNLYWFAYCTDSATAALYSAFTSANEVTLYNVGTQIRSATAANPCTGTGSGLTMPAFLGALTANSSKDTAPGLQGRP